MDHLLRYKPETGEVDVLATRAALAISVAVVDADETSVLYSTHPRSSPP